MARNFVGKWNFEKSENFEKYLRAVGLNMVVAKLADATTPTVYISVTGDTWTLKSESTFKSSSTEFKLGEEFEETTADGRKLKTTFRLEGDTMLIQEQKDLVASDIISVITREVTGNKMVVKAQAKDIIATRYYGKA